MKKLVVLVCMMAMTAFGQYASKLTLLNGADTAKNTLIGVLDTNYVWISGASSNEANGLYLWNEDTGYTNASESLIYDDSGSWTITNAAWGAGEAYVTEQGWSVGTDVNMVASGGIGGSDATLRWWTNGLGGDFVAKYAAYNSPTNYDDALHLPFAVRAQTAGVFFAMDPDYDNASTVQLTLQKSMDKTNWVSALVFNVPGTSTALATYSTNLTIGEYGWLRVYNITNNSITPVRSLFLELYHK